ncbi:hypothetical protein LINGRAHAP2_LOCUS29856 [Linum grandiflorum]
MRVSINFRCSSFTLLNNSEQLHNTKQLDLCQRSAAYVSVVRISIQWSPKNPSTECCKFRLVPLYVIVFDGVYQLSASSRHSSTSHAANPKYWLSSFKLHY